MNNTIDALTAFGVDTGTALRNCQNNEQFYLRIFDLALRDSNLERLSKAYGDGNLQETVDAALCIRGTMNNVGAKKISDSAQEIAYRLRTGETLEDVQEAVLRIECESEKLRGIFK